MNNSSISEINKELKTLDKNQLVELCLRVGKYKKENKELLSYLIFDATNENLYVENVKQEINTLFSEVNRQSAYTTKKGLQKIVRAMNRFIKYSDIKQTELEIRIHFCNTFNNKRISLDLNPVISNLYYREIEKIKTAFSKLHEDLQYDYKEELEKLNIQI